VGQYFQHRRDSGFIDGARYDARSVASHLLDQDASDPLDARIGPQAA
jgi:hypothetical protein